ncbi:metal-binding protein [Lyngbya sp. CCY1209]|uniref:metal-binding protein n=1 Tax=Lyngbya sp. CCY1209 TaxID=2886103 RepID=UPI002D21145E|nr:metal-binding protein [Lyngbya sp. CCY1209]MEB3886806.1 metal-binding protein [Lyngbya sp. CCY1209]
MPSGKTHDRITLWSLPLVAGLTFGQTRSSHLTLLVSASFLFGGLMFGPDLDIDSRQFQRWGWLRWMWQPYQNSLRHRSFLSHGPFIGTALRVLYLGTWLAIFAILVAIAANFLLQVEWDVSSWAKDGVRSLAEHHIEAIAIFSGLELGAMSHYLSDWGSSAYKRLQTKGVSQFFPRPAPPKKRKTSTSRRSRSASPSGSAKKTTRRSSKKSRE